MFNDLIADATHWSFEMGKLPNRVVRTHGLPLRRESDKIVYPKLTAGFPGPIKITPESVWNAPGCVFFVIFGAAMRLRRLATPVRGAAKAGFDCHENLVTGEVIMQGGDL